MTEGDAAMRLHWFHHPFVPNSWDRDRHSMSPFGYISINLGKVGYVLICLNNYQSRFQSTLR